MDFGVENGKSVTLKVRNNLPEKQQLNFEII